MKARREGKKREEERERQRQRDSVEKERAVKPKTEWQLPSFFLPCLLTAGGVLTINQIWAAVKISG